MAHPVLWHFPISHYNEKVRWALDWKHVPHTRVALGAGYLPRALWATGQGSLPILFLDGRAIADSTRIIAALEERHPMPPLYPAEPDLRRRALEIEEFFDEEVGHAMRAAIVGPLFQTDPAAAVQVLSTGMAPAAARAMGAILPAFRAFYLWRHRIDPGELRRYRAQVTAGLDRIAAEVGPSGHLVGDAFTVADLTAAALLSPLALPAEHPYPPPGPTPPILAEFQASVARHPGYQWVTETYRRFRGTSAEARAA